MQRGPFTPLPPPQPPPRRSDPPPFPNLPPPQLPLLPLRGRADAPRGVVHGAALALLAFTGLTCIALTAWFRVAPQPWSWRSIVAIVTAALGLTTCVLVWRAPSRAHALAGAIVVAMSLVRVGPPADWTLTTFILILVTGLLLVPIVRAVVLLPWTTR